MRIYPPKSKDLEDYRFLLRSDVYQIEGRVSWYRKTSAEGHTLFTGLENSAGTVDCR